MRIQLKPDECQGKTLRTVSKQLLEEKKHTSVKKPLREDLTFQLRNPLKVDRENHIIHDVKILGWTSKNKNRRYSPKGIDPSLYEGAVVNIDHPDGEEAGRGPRPLSARFGEIRGAYKRDDGLYAKELHYIPTHPLCESILYMAEHKPHLFGCSQNAFGDVYEDASGEIVETVTDVRSIDLVSEPATTKGLFEGAMDGEEEEQPDPEAEAPPEEDGEDMPDIPMNDAPPAAPGGTEDGAETSEDDPEMAGTAADDMDDSGGGMGGGGGINIDDEMLSMMQKIFQSGLPPKVMKKKLGHLIDTHCHLMQEGVMRTKVQEAARKKSLQEAAKLKTIGDAKKFLLESRDPAVLRAGKAIVGKLDIYETTARLKAKKELAEGLCRRAKLPKEAVTEFFLRKLTECVSEKEMMEAIEDRRQITGLAKSGKPRSSGYVPLEEGTKRESDMTEKELEEARKKMEDKFVQDAFRMPSNMN